MGWEDRAFNRDGSSYRGGASPWKSMFPVPTRLTLALLIACTAVFILQEIFDPLTYFLLLQFPSSTVYTQPWRWITYQYAHAGGPHLLFNLIGIYFFVPLLERLWGWRRTLIFYTIGGIVAGICAVLLSLRFPPLNLIGASGAIMAIIGATAAIDRGEAFLFFFIPMKMRTLALLLGIYFLLMILIKHSLADAAHLGGLIFGFVAPLYGISYYHRWGRQLHQRRIRRDVRAKHEEQETVDRILDKVHSHGMNSLTRSERRALQKATQHQKHREESGSRMRARL